MAPQAYSCEYQGTAIQYLVTTDLVQSSVHILSTLPLMDRQALAERSHIR
jgi:hypothetical protein